MNTLYALALTLNFFLNALLIFETSLFGTNKVVIGILEKSEIGGCGGETGFCI